VKPIGISKDQSVADEVNVPVSVDSKETKQGFVEKEVST
jgi:hypothetical protein